MWGEPEGESGAGLPIAESELLERLRRIDLLVVDVDGVMTDGAIVIDDHGVESKQFSVRDGTGFHLWRQAGKRAAILSGRSAKVVAIRAAELGIAPVIQNAKSKLEPFGEILRELGVPCERACFMGDDLADLPVLTAPGLGLAACPSDAADEVRSAVHLIAGAPGGKGAVRSVIEHILKAQGSWAWSRRS